MPSRIGQHHHLIVGHCILFNIHRGAWHAPPCNQLVASSVWCDRSKSRWQKSLVCPVWMPSMVFYALLHRESTCCADLTFADNCGLGCLCCGMCRQSDMAWVSSSACIKHICSKCWVSHVTKALAVNAYVYTPLANSALTLYAGVHS